MTARAVTTKQTVLKVLDLPLLPNAEITQGDNSLGVVNWEDLVIGFPPLQEGRWSVLFSVSDG